MSRRSSTSTASKKRKHKEKSEKTTTETPLPKPPPSPSPPTPPPPLDERAQQADLQARLLAKHGEPNFYDRERTITVGELTEEKLNEIKQEMAEWTARFSNSATTAEQVKGFLSTAPGNKLFTGGDAERMGFVDKVHFG